jgi:uncharacterized protein YbjT (DUF2867 family)
MRVLVTGATGFVGRRLVPALVGAGHDVTVLVRDAERYDPRPDVRVVEGDLLEPGSFEAALDVEVAYYLVHSMTARDDFAERDRQAAEAFAAAASDAGVERVVYLGGLGEERDHLSDHLRSRREVERVLEGGSYALTTLRAAIVVGAGSAGFEMIRQLATRLPVMVTPKWVQTPCQPIAIDDAVAYLVGVLDVPETAGETYEIGGPEVLTYAEMIRRVGRHLGREPIIVDVPVLTPRLSAYWVGAMTDVPWSVARPLIEGLKNPVVVHDDRVRELVPVEPTSFDDAIRRALAREESRDAEDPGNAEDPGDAEVPGDAEETA